MLWQTSIAPQRLAPLGEIAMTCAGQTGLLVGGEKKHNLGRWRR